MLDGCGRVLDDLDVDRRIEPRIRGNGLLAIIDLLEEPRRGALEGDCQFLIAQSLHLEALARMGESR